ncbi:hypothetical protein [Solidesulfovibrio alcoholivorans]|uniref:hypothetical protein n=1 Tax=Solidesulfovibrio alcoholivorans TaxID=81406 RepID=UPI000AECB630|nr:hypothetical protein [Solidesulfovibrio alcoholivorans]
MINNNLHNVLNFVNNDTQSNNNIAISCNIDKFSGTLFFDDNYDDINCISQNVQMRNDVFSYTRKDGLLTINFRRYSSYGFKIILSEYYRYVRFSFSSKLLRMCKESKYIDYIEEFFSVIQFNISNDYIRKFLRPSLVEVHVDIFGAAAHRDWINARKLLIDNVLDDKPENTQKAKINKYYNANYETLTINKNDKPLLIKEMLETVSDNDNNDKLCSSVKIYDKLYDIMIAKYGINKHWLKAYSQQLFGFNDKEIDYFIDTYSKLTIKERQQVYSELSSRLGITRYEFTLTNAMIKKMCAYKKNPLSEIFSYNIQNCIDFKRDLMLYLINNIWSISRKTRISKQWKLIPIISKILNLLKNDEIIHTQPTKRNNEEEIMGKSSKLNKNTRGLKGRLRTIQKDIDDLFTGGYDVNGAINDLRESSNIITAIFDNVIRHNQIYKF